MSRRRWPWERRYKSNSNQLSKNPRGYAQIFSHLSRFLILLQNMRIKRSIINRLSCFRIIHLACTFIFHFTIMRDLEKMAGWLRLAIIYFFSGIGGYLYSAILLPYQAEVICSCFRFILFWKLLVFFMFLEKDVDLFSLSFLPNLTELMYSLFCIFISFILYFVRTSAGLQN